MCHIKRVFVHYDCGRRRATSCPASFAAKLLIDLNIMAVLQPKASQEKVLRSVANVLFRENTRPKYTSVKQTS